MKYLWISGLLLLYPLQAELTVQKIDEMVAKIQGKRQSKVQVDFEKVVSPFGIVVQDETNSTSVIKTVEQEVNFKLSAIMNDRAKINGRWVKADDTVQGYKVESIDEDRVELKKESRKVELFLPNPDKAKLFQIK